MSSEHAFAHHELLTSQEERSLARRIERGDLEAKERLVRCNLRLVATVARRHIGRGLSMEDLLQEGVVGLIRAAEKYDWRRGTRFSTYAVPWIRQGITHALANTRRLPRLPAPQRPASRPPTAGETGAASCACPRRSPSRRTGWRARSAGCWSPAASRARR